MKETPVSMYSPQNQKKKIDSRARQRLKETIDANYHNDPGFIVFTKTQAKARQQKMSDAFQRGIDQYYANSDGSCCQQGKLYVEYGSAMSNYQNKQKCPCKHAISEGYRAQKLLYPDWTPDTLKKQWNKMSDVAKTEYYNF